MSVRGRRGLRVFAGLLLVKERKLAFFLWCFCEGFHLELEGNVEAKRATGR